MTMAKAAFNKNVAPWYVTNYTLHTDPTSLT